MTDYQPAILALEDGSLFRGRAVGALGQTVGEVVFNTAITGYQEILTDPSYARQIVTLTYPHIGNVGTNYEDHESSRPWAAGLVIRDLPRLASNWRCQQSLKDYLITHHIVAIADIDTRRLTRLLRDKGAMRGCILTKEDPEQALANVTTFEGMAGLDLAKEVSTTKVYSWCEGSWQAEQGYRQIDPASQPFHVVAYDFGVKQNILRLLVDRGCRITVVPAQFPAEELVALKPDGVLLSNGPGDPGACDYAIKNIQYLLKKDLPLLGICLGHQLLGLACGAETEKMKFGHHGANHPVQEIDTKSVYITSQNHGFTVKESTLPSELIVTHRSLFDGSLQGIKHKTKPVYSFQGHPEASPGPHDIQNLFDGFITAMNKSRQR